MKKSIIIAITIVLTLISCNKETGNTGVLKSDQTKLETVRYVAEDGSSALVTYPEENGEKFISINSNKKTIKVRQESTEGDKIFYRQDGIEVTKTGDSLIITQGNNIIGLKKAGGI